MSSRDSDRLFRKRTWLDWLRYSGASLSITFNPFHWSWRPHVLDEPLDTWVGPNESRFYFAWLMVTVRLWIDDGSW